MNVIEINLPKNNDEILLLFNFPLGYLDEKDDDFGLIHLTEHYLVTYLEKKLELLGADGTVNDTENSLFLNLKKKKFSDVDSATDRILELIRESSDSVDKKILDNEKKRIEIELEDKYSSTFSEISYEIESKIIKEPRRFKRHRLDQIKNIKRFNEKDIKRCIKKLLESNSTTFVGYKGNSDPYGSGKFKKFDSRRYQIKPARRKLFKFASKNKVLKKANNFGIFFPIDFDLYKDPKNFYSFVFACSKFYEKFSDNVYYLGVYKTEYLYTVGYQNGFIWFFLNTYSPVADDIEKIFFKTLNETLSSNDLKDDLEKFKQRKKSEMKLDWNDFYERFEWITQDILNGNFIGDLNKVTKDLSGVTPERVKKVSRRIFTSKSAKVIKT